MRISPEELEGHNLAAMARHQSRFSVFSDQAREQGISIEDLLCRIAELQISIPSWALGTGGTRFGRFPAGGEPRNLEEKMEDIGLLHTLTRSCGSLSLHIPWDIPKDPQALKQLSGELSVRFDAVNSNTFQDQPGQAYSYKFGSLSHQDPQVRRQAIDHNIKVIEHGISLGTRVLSLWLSDGSSYPGQQDLGGAYCRTLESLKEIYGRLPSDWTLLLEYKPFEPHYYSMVIPDWGTSSLLCRNLGPRARVLVDLGHHLPHTNIEQIVSLLLLQHQLGGFHFNDSRYGDDDLSAGSQRPFQLFLIFHELVVGMEREQIPTGQISWMIDASHNLKDPLEDLLQSLEAIRIAYAQALLVSGKDLEKIQNRDDPAQAQELLQNAFRTDVRPLLAEARLRAGAALDPLGLYRSLEVRQSLILQRGSGAQASGL